MKIQNNKIRLLINDDENKVIEFNPSDLRFAQKLKVMYDNLTNIKIESQDIDGLIKVCEIIENNIDELFGAGTSAMVFEGQMDILLYHQFINELIPYAQKASEKRVAKYINK